MKISELGTELRSMPCLKNHGREIVVCPSHGLAWNCKTGEMVPQSELAV